MKSVVENVNHVVIIDYRRDFRNVIRGQDGWVVSIYRISGQPKTS